MGERVSAVLGKKVESANDVASSLARVCPEGSCLFVMAGPLAPPRFDLLGPEVSGVLRKATKRATRKAPRAASAATEDPADKAPRKKRQRKNPPKPGHEEIWQELHASAPPVGKRVTHHKPYCACIMCKRG